MTIKQWEKIGTLADQEYVDFSSEGKHNIKGWSKKVKKMNIISENDVCETFGGWEGLFWEALEYA